MFSPTQNTHDYMSLVLTHACNRACPFCVDAYRGSPEYMSMATVAQALDFAKAKAIRDVLLVGGEPTLHPNLVRIVLRAKDAGLRVILTTNYDRPDLVRRLDGLVDCFNLSYYGQSELPCQADFTSDLTLHTLIHGRQLAAKEELDAFIETHRSVGHLKFSTLVPCTPWARAQQVVPYLDALDCEWVVLFNEILGQLYRGAVIKRYDRLINPQAHQSYKAHVDGTITQTWDRPGLTPWWDRPHRDMIAT